MAWWLSSENIIAYVPSFMTAWPGGYVQKIYRLRHILYDSMTWWLSSEYISLTSHPL